MLAPSLRSYDGVTAGCVLVVGYFGHRAHRPRWLARAMLLYGLGCLLFALPQFLGGRYRPVGGGSGGADAALLCSAVGAPGECAAKDPGYLGVFAAAIVLLGLGASPIYTLGTVLIDDNTDPK